MPYTIGFLEDEGILIIENIGKLAHKDFVKQSQEAIELARMKNAWLFLSDCTLLIAQANTFKLLDFPELYAKLGMLRTSKVAVLMSEEEVANKDVRFYETICLNRGWQVRVFSVKDAAVEWLLG